MPAKVNAHPRFPTNHQSRTLRPGGAGLSRRRTDAGAAAKRPCPHGREQAPSTDTKRSARAPPAHVQREAPYPTGARKRSFRPGLDSELAARDRNGRAADFDTVDLVAGAVDAHIQLRRTADLDALRDLDLLAELDAAVTDEMEASGPAAEPVAGSSATPDAGANMRVFHFFPEPAKQLTPIGASFPSAPKSGSSAATSSSLPSSRNT